MGTQGKNIGLMFGSFNPPQDGHVDTARKARDRQDLDEVRWMPVPVTPFKRSTLQATFEQKVEMCGIVARPHRDWLRVDDSCQNFKPGFVRHMQSFKRVLERMTNDNPDSNFYIIGGSDFDQRLSLAVKMLGMINFIGSTLLPSSNSSLNLPMLAQVNQRLATAYEVLHGTERVITERSSLTNSTREREILAGKRNEPSTLPPELQAYIAEHGLYRS
jgi:nicotinate-nucleotide adenylyltransferase